MKVSRTQLVKIGWITLAWTIFSMFEYFIKYSVLVEYGFDSLIDVTIPLKAGLITGLLAGLIGGSAIIFLWEKWLRSKPYAWTIRSTLVSYTLIFVVVSFATTTYFQSRVLGLSAFDPLALERSWQRLLDVTTLLPFVTWLTVSILTVIVLLVNDKYGPGVFGKFLLGRYFNPRREERVFMFLDLRSSTALAEEMGEERYFSFLRDVFKYATPAILENEGEIYQYVGDEIVVSWELNRGIKDSNCVECYFEIQQALHEHRSFFMDTYGHLPEFKAGIHCGHVMMGEIGVVKREIAYSGDVLNTTARIQDKCNELGENLLASKQLVDLLSFTGSREPREIGDIELRGRKGAVALCAL